ncbi:FAD-dependent oxidoreductase [Sphingobium tyrosinilyticum]|uniref:FAD-dependent oxidoreductase n=1 Tax=Sphingobium tyrosinilyticum TaxID=2715436 RepID=A0ABV9F1F0_9SPHN
MVGFDETFDWVVIGSGAGSMSSGLLMRQTGKSVVILEKTEYAGGTSAKSGGVMWMPDNPFMDPGEDSVEKAMTYLDAVVGDAPDQPGTSREKRMAYIVQGRQMVEFLLKNGVELERGSRFWPDYYDELPGGVKTSRTVVAKPYDKSQLKEWAPRLRTGTVELPVRLDDGIRLGFLPPLAKIALMGRVGVKLILGKLTGKHWVSAGAALQGRMLQAALKAGVDIRLESPVSELVVEDGKVTGVVTVKDDKPWRVGARLGVLVNAGGFARNQEMRDRYMPGTRAEWSLTPEGDTGDMHREMERIGGVLAQMDQMVGYQMIRAPGWEQAYMPPCAQGVTAKPHAILVDQSGDRYMNEGGSYEEYCERMLERNKSIPAVPSWGIADQQFMDQFTLASGGVGKTPKAWLESDYVKKADTIEELAKLINIDPPALKATIDRWNGFVEKGSDEDFHRGDRTYDGWLGDHRKQGAMRNLGTIAKAPFYAFDVVPGDVSTYGGIVTDVHSRVLRADGSPIEGLYATGVSTASPMGRVYPGAGSSVGPSMTFGWIAARHAAGLGNHSL